MKFPRNAKILGSYFDAAPFAAVFFVLVIFLLLGALLPVPGLRMKLTPPAAADLPGVSQRTVAMAVDAQNRLYFQNQIVTEPQLKAGLATAVKNSREPLTLVIHADRAVSYETLAHLALLAREPETGFPGITNLLLATLPRVEDAPAPR
jgi:biopolymer transport protein ExbD